MDINILIRNIKLQELGIGELSIEEQIIFDFLNENLKDLNTYPSNRYPNWLCIGRDRKNIILNYDKTKKFLYLSHEKIWVSIRMDYGEIGKLIGLWVESTLNLEIKQIDYTDFLELS